MLRFANSKMVPEENAGKQKEKHQNSSSNWAKKGLMVLTCKLTNLFIEFTGSVYLIN
jgi:hypothetical protein